MSRLTSLILLLLILAPQSPAAPPAKSSVITGVIKNKDNSPAPRCVIRLFEVKPEKTPPGPTRQPPALAETHTNDKGEFRLDNIAAGNYRLIAGTLFKDSVAADVKVVGGKPLKVELTLITRKNKL